MRELIAGEGGSVLVAGASSASARALACEGLARRSVTPSGIPVFSTDELPDDLDVDVVRFVGGEQHTQDAVAGWAEARGLAIVIDEPTQIAPPDGVRVVAVSAVSTGSGKTALVRRVARTLSRSSVRVAVARHPIADLLLWDRFDPIVVRSPSDLVGERPVSEREELAPVVGTGVPVVVGLDPERIVRLAAAEAQGGVVVWDGGGAATPWVRPDLHLVAVDLLRGLPANAEARVSSADAVVLTKADTAPPDRARTVEALVRSWNPGASIVLADLAVGARPVNVLADRRVVIVEDAMSLMLGGLSAGAGAVAAKRFRCGVVDPRPFALGAIAEALRDHPHIGAVIPALGRTREEIDDLAASVMATPGDAILWASNADPTFIIEAERRPIVRAYGELTEVAGPPLQDVLASLLPGHS